MPTKTWDRTLYTYVWVFNTGRGLSVCIRLPLNFGIIYDLGCSEDFSPVDFIGEHIVPKLTNYDKCSIAQIVLSHPHADHIAEISAAKGTSEKHGPLYPALLTCPNDKTDCEKLDFSRVNNPEGKQKLVEQYREAYKERNPPLQTIQHKTRNFVPNVEYGLYYMRPPACARIHDTSDQDYTNSVSIVLYLRHGNQSLLVPADITPEVFERVLRGDDDVERRYTFFYRTSSPIPDDLHSTTSSQPILRRLLADRGLTILVAPHHGLKSGYSEYLFSAIKGSRPTLNVISERRHLLPQDGTVDASYQGGNGAIGVSVDIDGTSEKGYSVSTRDGRHILIVFKGTDQAPHVYLRKDPENLLEIVP